MLLRQGNFIKQVTRFLVLCCSVNAWAEDKSERLNNINGVIIPEAFGLVLCEGINLPLFIRLKESENGAQQKIGYAVVVFENRQIKIREIYIEQNADNVSLSDETLQALSEVKDRYLKSDLTLAVSQNTTLNMDLRTLYLSLTAERPALSARISERFSHTGPSSIQALSSTLSWNFGAYQSYAKSSGSTGSNYLSLSDITSLAEHHLIADGAVYGLGTQQRQSSLYKLLYEHDFAGRRMAAGMLDSWNLQSLGPVSSLANSKIYGVSWGNQAQSVAYDDSQSLNPVTVFLPAAGEVHIRREGKLLSVQNFAMGSYEINTRSFPYGNYDVEIEINVNGRVVEKRTERINKFISSPRGGSKALSWQLWGGRLDAEKQGYYQDKSDNAAQNWLAGVSFSAANNYLGWANATYGYGNIIVNESRITAPFHDAASLNFQSLLANDASWGATGNINLSLPGGFSSLWAGYEYRKVGNRLLNSESNNWSAGGAVNLASLWARLGSVNGSYNNNKKYGSHYYNIDYQQNIISGRWGNLAMRTGMRQYSNYGRSETENYIALDLSVPFGNGFSAGVSHEKDHAMANLSVKKSFNDGVIRSASANLAKALDKNSYDDGRYSANGNFLYQTKYAHGGVNLTTNSQGDFNSNYSASGVIGWQGKNIAASSKNNGSAGIILKTDIEDNDLLSARVDNYSYPLTGKANYLSLHPYAKHQVELLNSKKSESNYSIVNKQKSEFILYPGNVAVIKPEIRQRVTVFGRIRAEDGTLLSHAYINNHIGKTRTDENGEFILDVDKKYPVIDFSVEKEKQCEVELDLKQAKGAVWVGDVTCVGLKSYAQIKKEENEYEG